MKKNKIEKEGCQSTTEADSRAHRSYQNQENQIKKRSSVKSKGEKSVKREDEGRLWEKEVVWESSSLSFESSPSKRSALNVKTERERKERRE